MKRKREFLFYTSMWIIATLFLLTLLWRNMGDAKVINYSGIVRGATQKLVKEELAGQPDDDLIEYLDQVIYDLQTGKGRFDLVRNRSEEFQDQLSELKLVWEEMKEEIPEVRDDIDSSDTLYTLSQQHFKMADEMVHYAEQDSENRVVFLSGIYGICMILSVTYFSVSNRRNQKRIEVSLSTDRLTGLLSRRGFEERAEEVLRKTQSQEYVIVEFDINNFKGINSAYGYEQGDLLLKNLAELILKWKGKEVVCARINADNFVLLSERYELLIAELKDLLRQAVKSQHVLAAFGNISFTIGAYFIKDNQELIKTIMDKADTAHKMAKREEDITSIWYDEKLIEKINLENKYKEQMRHGMETDEFQMYLQPKVGLSDLELIGAEALVRWNMADNGLIFPDAFIPLFEKNGSIVELDYYMLKKVCVFLRSKLDKGQPVFPISVNVSRVTLYHDKFYDTVLQIVDSYGLPHRYVEMEITESAFNEVTDGVLQTIQRLRNAGFHISMDDFGAGYSNLNTFSRLPIQIIKLDRAFMLGVEENKRIKGILSSVIDMAHAMEIKVVCEGVEREEHVQLLREIGCDYAQGYYFSKPISVDQFQKLYQM